MDCDVKTGDGRSRAELGERVLSSVSRSFYISIRVLPEALREPVGLAYLLARATDTVADTVRVPLPVRLDGLDCLGAAIQSDTSNAELEDFIQSVVPHQENAAERELIERLPACLGWLGSLRAEDRGLVRDVLSKIVQGQEMDLTLFRDPKEVVALPTSTELEEYIYLVAGCVGEFWTRICSRHVGRFSSLDLEVMNELGVRFGKGLQLVNILRDFPRDLEAGRCYLPEHELKEAGVSELELLRQDRRAAYPVLEKWVARAGEYLRDGRRYVSACRNRRCRFAAAVPVLLGVRTLSRLRETLPEGVRPGVKVSRAEVYGIMMRAFIGLWVPGMFVRPRESA